MTEQQLHELASLIDNACDQRDAEELKIIIACNQDYVENLVVSKTKAILYYFLANAWHGLRLIKHGNDEDLIWDFEQDELNNEIIYLRKAKNEKAFSQLSNEYQCSVLTNLANIFSHVGRTILAIRLLNQALSIDKTFFMALANRGTCFKTYAILDYDEGHTGVFLNFAYRDLNKAVSILQDQLKLTNTDKSFYEKLLSKWNQEIRAFEEVVDKERILNGEPETGEFDYCDSQEERDYRQWVLKKGLFINPMNDIGSHNIASHDPLHLPDMITHIDIFFPKYITYFNQIKEEFVAFRHLLYEGCNKRTKSFFDKDTSIVEDYDNNLYEVDIEKLKISFRGFYSIFDKIAYFLNDYYLLGFDNDRIDFRKIWREKETFKNFENIALRGLYFISKDLFLNKNEDQNFQDILEPEAEKINDIRNHLEHKFLSIKSLNVVKDGIWEKREKVESITQDDLVEKSLYLARLVREAILYLSFTVHIEEEKKDKKIKAIPIILTNRK